MTRSLLLALSLVMLGFLLFHLGGDEIEEILLPPGGESTSAVPPAESLVVPEQEHGERAEERLEDPLENGPAPAPPEKAGPNVPNWSSLCLVIKRGQVVQIEEKADWTELDSPLDGVSFFVALRPTTVVTKAFSEPESTAWLMPAGSGWSAREVDGQRHVFLWTAYERGYRALLHER